MKVYLLFLKIQADFRKKEIPERKRTEAAGEEFRPPLVRDSPLPAREGGWRGSFPVFWEAELKNSFRRCKLSGFVVSNPNYNFREYEAKMGRPMNVAVAGATGAVGVEMIETLEKRNFPIASLKLLASARSAGKKRMFKGEEITIEEMTEDSFKGVDIALFSAGSDISRKFRQACVDAGCVMIDNSSAFRMEEDVPLVIPEINPEDAFRHHGVIANPNCTTAIMAVAVYPLHKAKGLKRLIASTYQAASGGGAPAMQELIDQTRAVLNGETRIEAKVMAQRLAFNLFPHIDSFQPNGYTKEELKMVNETRKIMHIPGLMLTCTSVRVPVMRAHSESLNLEFEQDITPEEAREILSKAPGVIVRDDPENKIYPMPVDATGKYDVIVGRIRQDISRSDKRGIEMFVSGDQLLKGAALNAVQIAEVLNR